MVQVFPCGKVNSYDFSRPAEEAAFNFASVEAVLATVARSNFLNFRHILYKPNLPLAMTILFRVFQILPEFNKGKIKCTAK